MSLQLARDILNNIKGMADAQRLSVLSDGPVTISYFLERAADQFVLRIDKPLAGRLGLDRSWENEVLAQVSEQGLGPEPVYCDPDSGVLMTRYMSGDVWSEADLRQAERLHKLAGLLRKIHALPAAGQKIDLRVALNRYASLVDTSEAWLMSVEAEALLAALLPGSGTDCLCHHDVHVGNIIGLDRLLLIDWEYAALGDPLFDLATVIEHHGLSETQVTEFLAAYSQGEIHLDNARLALYRQLYIMLCQLWQAAVKAGTPDR